MQRLCHVCHGTPSPPSAASGSTAEIDGTSIPTTIIAQAGLERPVSESWYWDLWLRVAQEQN
jgi:hypothetical protein